MKIRPYQKGDEKAIMDLDARALPSKWNPRTLENWYWKFTDKNPNGHAIIWVADHKEQMVAHFAAVPYKLKTFGHITSASHSIGALVEEKYQNRGLLKLVGDKMLEELKEKEVPFTWGFPNKRAYTFETKVLGYHDLTNFDIWQLEKDKIFASTPNPGIRKITLFGEEFDRLWQECSPGYDVAVVREKEYLNWRFLQRPDWEYFPFALYDGDELKGYTVFKLYREEETLRGHFIDFFARRDDKETIRQLIHHGFNFFSEKEVDEITVWIWGNPLIEELFTQNGFSRIQADIPLILKTSTPHKYREQVLDKANWYFTMADSTEIF